MPREVMVKCIVPIDDLGLDRSLQLSMCWGGVDGSV